MPDLEFEAIAAELGAVAGQIERESSLRIEAAISEMRRIDAERELRLVNLERRIEERLAGMKDGLNGKDGRDGLDGKEGAAGLNGRDGIDGTAGRDGIDGQNGKDGIDGSPGVPGADGKDGRDGIDGAPGRDGVNGKPGERGLEGPPGKLPTVRRWEDRVYYEGEVAAQGGATYQAIRDTGRAPPHEDWNCIAAAGRDGVDGRSFDPIGTWNSEKEYKALNVVAMNGASFAARWDNPGPCPGDGWQLIASQGKQGKPGDRGVPGQKGDRGEPGPAVVRIDTDSEGLLRLVNGDGTIVDGDLYPMLSRLG